MKPHIASYTGSQPGPHVLMLGGVHGNEPCGTRALEALQAQLESGAIKIMAGQLTIVPCCNPLAASMNQRQVDANLNRVFVPHATPTLVEHHLANLLCPLVAKADYILDLHSTSAATPAYVFLDYPDEASRCWLNQLGLGYVVTGWPALHQVAGDDMSTQEYAHQVGRVGLTVECGQHDDPAATLIATTTIKATLAHFGLLSDAARPLSVPHYLNLETVHYKKMAGTFSKPWENFSGVRAGELLATYSDGSRLTAPADGYILLPKESADIGEDWLYFAASAGTD